MSSSFESLSPQHIKQDGDSQRARRQIMPVAAPASPSHDVVEPVEEADDPILPRRGEDSTKTLDMISVAKVILSPSTTLRTSVRPTGSRKSSSASRRLRPPPPTTGRPALGPTGFQTVRPPLSSAAVTQPSRPLLGPSGPPSQVPVTTSSSRSSLSPVTTSEPIPTASVLAPPVQPVPASTGIPGSALPDQTAAQPSITATPTSGLDAGSIVGYILLALGMSP